MFELECFQIILHSGDARNYAREAIESSRENNIVFARALLEKAEEEYIEAGKLHAKLLQQYVCDESLNITMLIVHAEDHMSSSQVMLEVAQELVNMNERLSKYE